MGVRFRIAISWARRILVMVSGHHAPAFTVASLATITAGLPSMTTTMIGLDKRALRAAWTVFLFALLLTVVWRIRATLVVFAAAIFFAYMLSPLVGLIERFIHRRRGLALTIVYCLFIGLMVLIGFQ